MFQACVTSTAGLPNWWYWSATCCGRRHPPEPPGWRHQNQTPCWCSCTRSAAAPTFRWSTPWPEPVITSSTRAAGTAAPTPTSSWRKSSRILARSSMTPRTAWAIRRWCWPAGVAADRCRSITNSRPTLWTCHRPTASCCSPPTSAVTARSLSGSTPPSSTSPTPPGAILNLTSTTRPTPTSRRTQPSSSSTTGRRRSTAIAESPRGSGKNSPNWRPRDAQTRSSVSSCTAPWLIPAGWIRQSTPMTANPAAAIWVIRGSSTTRPSVWPGSARCAVGCPNGAMTTPAGMEWPAEGVSPCPPW